MPVSIPLWEVELHLRGAPPSQHTKERYEQKSHFILLIYWFCLKLFLCAVSCQFWTATVTNKIWYRPKSSAIFNSCIVLPLKVKIIYLNFLSSHLHSSPPLPIIPAGFKETAFLYAISSAGLTHAMAKACSAGRMERCTCDEAPDLENRKAWQWGGCGDNLKYANKFVKDFLGKRSNKDLRARVDMHNTNVGMKVRSDALHCFNISVLSLLAMGNSTLRVKKNTVKWVLWRFLWAGVMWKGSLTFFLHTDTISYQLEHLAAKDTGFSQVLREAQRGLNIGLHLISWPETWLQMLLCVLWICKVSKQMLAKTFTISNIYSLSHNAHVAPKD